MLGGGGGDYLGKKSIKVVKLTTTQALYKISFPSCHRSSNGKKCFLTLMFRMLNI